ncbi:unnamed protein product (macronuclear) [Paramecium tetraurelia]|uniref:Transmembrane protein n=1 Tax=Paramecium tetraurelia TaxID=5888 RepID=A0CCH9_PARTE|nr:uncharacterized protein GSPATT00037281001 [Paramecium tetraurelia]CAK68496.1 unnamed protein product [Paramecium tetraurelia]|eukprot:XP_001435893.1 hypothetical protein (macronuclear) [Paramecium tetraurelia strain d4-2]
MNFIFFFNILLRQSISLEITSEVQTLYYYPGENKYTPELRYYVPFEQHLLDSKDAQFNIELMQEVKVEKHHLPFISDQTQLYYFQNITSEQDNMIMVLDNSNLYCLYLIKNYFLNQQLVIIPHFCNITLPYQSCSNLLQIKNQIIISNCQLNSNQVAISIINFDGKVLDEKVFEIESTCKLQISYGDSILFIYYQNCNSDNFYKMEIDQVSYQYTSFKIYDISNKNDDKVNSTYNQIEYINICNKWRHNILYSDKIVYYNQEILSQPYFLDQVNSTILKEFLFCKGHQFILYIDNDRQQLKFDDFDLNVNFSHYINSFWIDKILVLHRKDQIIAIINDQIQQKIDITISQLVPIINSTYIFGLYQGQLRLFKMQPPTHYHSFNVSQKIIYLIFQRLYNLFQFNLGQLNIEVLNESEPRIMVNKQDINIFQLTTEEICLEQAQISKNLPINIKAIKEGGKSYSIKSQNTEAYFMNFDEDSKILHFQKLNDLTNVLISIQSNNLVNLVFCKFGKVIQKYKIKILPNYIDISIFQKTNILIFSEDCIQYYKIENPAQILQKQIPQIKKIIKVNNYHNEIVILYDDCSKSNLLWIFENNLIIREQKYQSYNCTQTQLINLFSFENEIIYRSTWIEKYVQEGKVVKILEDVEQSLYLVIVEVGNRLILKFFRYFKNDFTFMYNVPAYNFIFELSATYKFQSGYLMLNAKNQGKTFLLVYYLKNQAINSLIYVTEIDSSPQFFSYYDIGSKKIAFLRDRKFQFSILHQICMNYTFTQQGSIIQVKQVSLVLNTLINNLTTFLDVMIFSLYRDYSLSLLNQKMRIIKNQDLIDWNSITGNIVNFKVQSSQNITINVPLNITQEYFSCLYFESNICLRDKYTIEIKSLNIKNCFTFQITDSQIKKIVFNQESLTYSIFSNEINFVQKFIVQVNKDKPDEFTLIKLELSTQLIDQVWKIKGIKEIDVIFMSNKLDVFMYYNNCQIFGLFNNLAVYYLFDGAQLSNNIYLFLHWNYSYIQISVVSFNNIQLGSQCQLKWDIIQYHDIKIQKKIEKIYSHHFHKELKQLQIINLEKREDLFFIKIALIYKHYFTLLYEVSFNQVSYDNLVIESYRFLRYEFNTLFLDLLYADNNFLVLTLQKDSQEYIHVYDIKGDMKYKDYLDSIQRIESFKYKKIEKFNESHYVIYSANSGGVYFMTLNPFKIECQGQCNETANLILTNDVSSLSLEIQFKNSSLFNVEFTIKSEILLANLIFILIMLKLEKRAKEIQVNQYKIGIE